MNKIVSKTIVISTGGTGGHVLPANQLARSLKAEAAVVPAVIDKRGHAYLDVDAFDRIFQINLRKGNGRLGKIHQLWDVFRQTRRCMRFFRSIKPDLVIGFGGYMSLPPLLAAKSLSIPYVLHEENSVLGRVNRFMARYASAIGFGFEPDTTLSFSCPTHVIGNPVRAEFERLSQEPRPRHPEGRIRLFIFGGSQGAAILSKVVPKAIELLPRDIQDKLDVVMQIREELADETCEALKKTGAKLLQVGPFFTDLPKQLWQADLVIARAGAMTVTEIAVMGRATVFVPLKIATDNHQFHNVAKMVENKAAWMLTETDFTPEALARTLGEMIRDEFSNDTEGGKRSEAIKSYGYANASERLVAICHDLVV